jgi:flavin reductase (DIM6/NTAB) family NADH-FMN oxidoreductase RutF
MAIGWGTAGIIWGLPIFIVLVRPTRFTFGLMEESREFTVNVPTEALEKQVDLCGTKSGRDMDKVKACGFKMEKGHEISIPYIAECPIHYECRVVHKNDVINAELDGKILNKSYPEGNLHRVYYGEILGVYRA